MSYLTTFHRTVKLQQNNNYLCLHVSGSFCMKNELLKKQSVDALLTEMSRDGVGTTYDREYQTGGNPFANSRDKDVAVPTATDPENYFDYLSRKHKEPAAKLPFTGPDVLENSRKTSRIDLLTGQVDGHDRVIAPGAHDVNVQSESTKNELDAEQAKDEEHLTVPKASSFDFEFDRNRKIAHRVASNHYFKQYVASENVKVHDDILMVNIPRGKFAQIELAPTDISRMERELSAALRVRAKYAHLVLTSGFDGACLEFMLV